MYFFIIIVIIFPWASTAVGFYTDILGNIIAYICCVVGLNNVIVYYYV